MEYKKYIFFAIVFLVVRQLIPGFILGKKIKLYDIIVMSIMYGIGKYIMDSYPENDKNAQDFTN